MGGRRQRLIVGAAATTACAVFIGYLAVGAAGQSLRWCERKDNRQIDAMEKRIDAELLDVSHTFERYSACEDTGHPGASLRVEVEGWTTRQTVRQQFRARGWVALGDGVLRSDDGRYRLRTLESFEANGTQRHLFATITSVQQGD